MKALPFLQLGYFWSAPRVARLKRLRGERMSAKKIANQFGIRPREVSRVLELLGLDAPPKKMPAPKTPAAAASVQGGVVNNLHRRLQILASATDHTPQQLVDYGWVKNAGVGEEEGGENVS